MIAITVRTHGPIPEDRFDEIVLDFLDDAVGQVGQQGLSGVHELLNERIKEPTTYYETQVMLQRAAAEYDSDVTPAVVHDRGVIYGWWLEGIGSRNHPVTSFRGYHTFRETAAALNKGRAVEIAETTLQRYLPRLRGES